MALNEYVESLMPEDVRKNVHSSYTMNRTGNVGHYQGGDACLEVNKDAKGWIKQIGVPSEREWLKVFRNLYSMDQVTI